MRSVSLISSFEHEFDCILIQCQSHLRLFSSKTKMRRLSNLTATLGNRIIPYGKDGGESKSCRGVRKAWWDLITCELSIYYTEDVFTKTTNMFRPAMEGLQDAGDDGDESQKMGQRLKSHVASFIVLVVFFRVARMAMENTGMAGSS